MTKHGCTKGGDGIFVCSGPKCRSSTARPRATGSASSSQEIVQAQAKKSGIEFVIGQHAVADLLPAASRTSDYQLALFAWVGSGDPSGITDIYSCGGESNWMGYCSKKVTDLLKAADQELDPAARVKLVNAAGKIMGLNVPRSRSYQKPTFLVFKTKLQGIRTTRPRVVRLATCENWGSSRLVDENEFVHRSPAPEPGAGIRSSSANEVRSSHVHFHSPPRSSTRFPSFSRRAS